MPGSTRRRKAGSDRRSRRPIALVLAGRALIWGRLQPVEIAIDDRGWIDSIGKIRKGEVRHDVGDAVILPAATDLHVHFREPGGPSEAETIATGTVGAALGGVGLVGEMPNTRPPVTDLESLQGKIALAGGRAAIDMLVYATPTDARALSSLARHAGGFKVYLAPTTGIDVPPKPAELPGLWTRLARLRLPVSVHAEDPSQFGSEARPISPVDWNAHRPVRAEEAALARLIEAPRSLRLHAAHVTTVEGARRLRAAGLSFEASPHHLLLSDRSGPDARWKVNPPLRTETARRALWEAFLRGEIPCVASDHAPHPAEAKSLPFDRAPSGVPGVETMLPLLLARVRTGELDLGVLVAAACDRPARWFGQPQGRIAPGHRANLLVVDFTRRSAVEGRRLQSPCGWSPFEGWEVVRPREHYRDGERIVEDGEFVGRTMGKVVRPEYALGEREPASGESG
ncbi:MAG TPA: dihydroorotase family protein [Thermoplasmata archaeon]|nr:dihydroorotase family protein [Thermoplasmata archaeon]